MEAVCGGRRPARWDDPCRLDLVTTAAGVTYSLLVLVMAVVWHTARRQRRSGPPPLPRRFSLHSARWLLALAVALFSLAALMDAVLADWYAAERRPHVWAAPAAALLGIFAVTALTGLSERDAAPGRLLANLLYCGLAAAVGACKAHFYLSVDGLDVRHVRVLATWATMFVYAALTALEVYFAFVERYMCSSYQLNAESDGVDLNEFAYKHPFASAAEKVTFSWIIGLLRLGNRWPIEFHNLGRSGLSGAGRQLSLWRVVWRTHRSRLLLGGFLKLCGDMVGFVAPLALRNIVEFVMRHRAGTLPTDFLERDGYLYPTVQQFLANGFVMSVVALVAALAQGTFSQCCTHVMVTEGVRLRSEIQALIYEKSLKIPCISNDRGASDDPPDPLGSPDETDQGDHVGNITSLQTDDADNLTELICQTHYVWAIPLKIVILLVLIYQQLGVSAIIGALVSIVVLTPLQFVVVWFLQKNKKGLLKKGDERLSLTAEFVGGIRMLKLNAMEFVYKDKIQKIRKAELKLLMKDSLFWALNTFLTQSSLTVVTVTTFGLFGVLGHEPLVSARVFSALALFNQLTVPLFVLPIVVKALIDAKASIRRLTDFLALADVEGIDEEPPQTVALASKLSIRLKERDASRRQTSVVSSAPTGRPTSTSSVASRTELPDSAPRRERPTSLELSSPATLGPRLSGSPAYAWGSQDSVFKLEEIPEGDEEFTATETSEESTSSSSPSPTGGEGGGDGEGRDGDGQGSVGTDGDEGGGGTGDGGAGREDGDGAGGDGGAGGSGADSQGGSERRRTAPTSPPPTDGAQDTEERVATEPGTQPAGNHSDHITPAVNGNAVHLSQPPTNGAPLTASNGTVTRASPRPADQPEGRGAPWRFPLPTITPKPALNLQGVRFTEPGEEAPPSAGAPQTPAVTVTAASFCWRCGGATALRDVGLTVPRGKLTMIVGPIGCGKSSLVTALLGELCRTAGSVTWARNTTFAYASQSPWLFNDSLRANVLFGRPLKKGRYQRVLTACDLRKDIELLGADEDSTAIGEQGSVLSGGQRQRVAVARALYSNANCVILDDPLSALDVHVGQHVFENGIRKMLLKEGRTVILVTHKLQYLKYADKIIALEAGRVRQQGTLQQIEAAEPELVNRWQELIRLDQQQETKEAAAETRTARERWRLIQVIQKFRRLPAEGPALPRDSFSVRRSALRRNTSLRHQVSHLLPMSLDDGDEYGSAPRRRWTTSARRGRGWDLLARQYGRSSSLRPATPGTPQSLTDGAEGGDPAAAARRQTLQRMASLPPTMPSPRGPARSGSVSEAGRRWADGFHRLMGRPSLRSSSRPTPSSEDLSGHPPSDQLTALVSLDPEPPAARPQVSRNVSIASTHSEQTCDDEEEADVDSRRYSEEEREKGKISKKLYLKYIRACGWGFGALYLLMFLLTQGMHFFMDYWLSFWSESASEWNITHARQWRERQAAAEARSAVLPQNVSQAYDQYVQQQTQYYLIVYAASGGVAVLLALAANVSGQYAGARARRHLHNKLLNAVTRSRKEFFEHTPAGRIINRFSTDVSFIDKKLATAIHILLYFVLQCATAVVANTIVNWWFIIIATVIGFIYYFLQRFYRTFAIELQRLDSIARSPIQSHFAETQSGLAVIRAYRYQGRFFSALLQAVDTHLVTSLLYECGQRWLGIALDYLGAVIVFASSITAVGVAVHSDQLSPGVVGLAINYTLLIPMYLVWVVRSLSDVEMYMCAVERVEKYGSLRAEDYRQNRIVADYWPRHGKIEFCGATIGYSSESAARLPAETNTAPAAAAMSAAVTAATEVAAEVAETAPLTPVTVTVLRDINLTIEPGQKVALVGRSGSGKSTLAMALFEMSDLLEGSIKVDGQSLSSLPLHAVRSRLALIPQEPLLFSGTVRSNLDPKCEMTDDQMWEALELVQLKDFISSLGRGLDLEVQEGGENFSVGQRQLLCLARALLRRARVVVMDEPTSSLDAETVRALQGIVQRAFRDSTVITIAHQIATVLDYDLLLVLDGGRLAEQGPPKQLAKKRDGLFAGMLRAALDQGASLTERIG
ncbi:ATP-binding cassette sub-family C member Sur [Amphibalanus amphitrite]|uniref:ATP-binding cassette sub-family C member Sur n=1 Tax=Amphibalanus amphitrite TaxID=1232801 RepID=A0A6A4VXT2_AMPAM|nr:ATP-binding cassette sub-family C member Sur [Amphibalanus amphitrite]